MIDTAAVLSDLLVQSKALVVALAMVLVDLVKLAIVGVVDLVKLVIKLVVPPTTPPTV